MEIKDKEYKEYSKEVILPILVAIVLFMEFLDVSIINTAIPSIAKAYAVNPILLKYSVTSYLLSLAIFIPISGYCTDKFGTKKIFIFSVSLFVVASFLCAISQNISELTLFRFLQGIGGAFMNPASRIIIVRLFPPKELVRIQGFIFTPALLGQVLGPFLGGLITNYLSWHWIFYINIPFGLFAIYMGNKYITQQVDANIKRFDWIGFIIVALSLSSISFFIDMLNHYEIISKHVVFLFGIIGIILFCILIIHCIKKQNPVLDFSLLKIKTFGVGFNINLSIYALNSSVAFLLPLMYQESFKFNPAKSGMLLLPIAFGYLLFRGIATKIIHKFGFRQVITTGSLLIASMVILLGSIQQDTSIYYIIFVEFFYGAAYILVGSSTGALNYLDIAKEQVARATSMDMTFRQFSASFGIGISAFFITSVSKYFELNIFDIDARLFHYTFYVLSLLAIIIMLNSLKLDRRDGANTFKQK